jgi:hypothetical protein
VPSSARTKVRFLVQRSQTTGSSPLLWPTPGDGRTDSSTFDKKLLLKADVCPAIMPPGAQLCHPHEV